MQTHSSAFTMATLHIEGGPRNLLQALGLATVTLFLSGAWPFVYSEVTEVKNVSPSHKSRFPSVCPAEFQGKCLCGEVPYGPEGKLTYVTNCTNTNFHDAVMLKELPLETEVLIFTGNRIPDLPFNVFGTAAMYNRLNTIDMSNNHIQSIKGKTFHHVKFVKKLVLNDNDLYIVSKDRHSRMFSNFNHLDELHLKNAFTEKVASSDYLNNLEDVLQKSQLDNLRILNLEQNELSSILNGNFFCSMPSLTEIYVGGNRMTDFRFNSTCLPRLELVDLSRNEISCLKNSTIHLLDAVPGLEVNLTGNPFECDCHLTDMYRWLATTKTRVTDKERLQCVNRFHPQNVWKLIKHVTLYDLECPLKKTDFHDHLSAAYVVMVLIIVICMIMVSLLVYRHRQAIYVFARSWFQPIRNKMKYSSLDKREAEMEV
ncbi:trophoblast glycoprotein-like isoform X1 [Tachypleus tridentatus]|uniref:trophoblast glycoprotein-like isoform X1 n=2 Tax=Tachypleus tridentatus TaxID=6853 RepID=UPI003FD4B810